VTGEDVGESNLHVIKESTFAIRFCTLERRFAG
jgi:hypothetical protein